MILKMISSSLILFTVFMGVKHGWSALNPTTQSLVMMEGLKISKLLILSIGILTFLAIILLFSCDFFLG